MDNLYVMRISSQIMNNYLYAFALHFELLHSTMLIYADFC